MSRGCVEEGMAEVGEEERMEERMAEVREEGL